jgi:hypothetical protein
MTNGIIVRFARIWKAFFIVWNEHKHCMGKIN